MININLLPPELKLKKIQAKRNASLMSVCLVIIIITVVLGIIARSAKATIETHLGSTQSDINQNNNTQEGNKNLEDMALLINDRAQETTQVNKTRAIWSEVLQELSNDSPSDVQFESITADITKSPNFTLTGNTSSQIEIIKFKDKLSASSFFKNVTFTNSSLNQSSTPNSSSQVKFTLEFDLAKFASSAGGSQ